MKAATRDLIGQSDARVDFELTVPRYAGGKLAALSLPGTSENEPRKGAARIVAFRSADSQTQGVITSGVATCRTSLNAA